MRKTYKMGTAAFVGAFGLLWLGAFMLVEPYCAQDYNPFDCDGPDPELARLAAELN